MLERIMLTFALAGPNGDYGLLLSALDLIKRTANNAPHRVIMLGNYLGTENGSRYIVSRLINNHSKGLTIVLKGMAEFRTISAMRGIGAFKRISMENWKVNYGESIAKAYAVAKVYVDEHLDWMNALDTYYVDDTFIAMSGFVDQSEMPQDAHPRQTVLGQGYFQPSRHISGKHLIHSNCSTVIQTEYQTGLPVAGNGAYYVAMFEPNFEMAKLLQVV